MPEETIKEPLGATVSEAINCELILLCIYFFASGSLFPFSCAFQACFMDSYHRAGSSCSLRRFAPCSQGSRLHMIYHTSLISCTEAIVDVYYTDTAGTRVKHAK